MKKAITNFAFPLLAIFTCVLLVSYKSNKTVSNSDPTPVGTIIYSVLPPEPFLDMNEGWAVLDGSALNPEWELSRKINDNNLQILNGKLPDASGMFFRAMNYNNIGADPDKTRQVGRKQYDMVEEHRHKFTVNGQTKSDEHSHLISGEDRAYIITGTKKICINCARESGGTNVEFYTYDDKYYGSSNNLSASKNTHSHKIYYSDTTGYLPGDNHPETRPVNTAFYVYIKVN